jgi:tyrosyl-tRNA synthetase
MSKSIPGSGISLTDSHEEIKKAISESYCPQNEVKDNPVLQINKMIVFPLLDSVKIKRPAKFGGDKEYKDYQDLEEDYQKGKLHPLDLKNSTINSLEEIIKPIRDNLK